LTIEHRGPIPDDLRRDIGSHVYGCDVCQEVCPWNVMAPVSDDAAWQPRSQWDLPRAADLARMTDDELAAATRRSPMRRAKPAGLRRNVDVVLENAGGDTSWPNALTSRSAS
jgi:epoxyqueuosine reductase